MAYSSPKEIFEQLIKPRVEGNPEESKQVDAKYKFVITGDNGGTWIVDLQENVGVRESDEEAPCTITMEGSDFLAINNGELDAQAAFMSGKMQITGDMSLAFKLGQVLGGGQ